jgi:hypothetical protein
MRKVIVVLSALVAISGYSAVKKPSPFAAIEEARRAFNKQYGEVFRGTTAMDYRVISEEARFDRAKGEGKWVFAMPLKNDSRIKYVEANFKDGAFLSGELLKFGLKSEKIDSNMFEALRLNHAMFAVKAGEGGKGRLVAFYPAGSIKESVRNNLIRYGVNISVEPGRYYLAKLCGIDGVLGVNMKDLKYAYTLTTADGDVIEMGSESKGHLMVRIMRKALEKLYPEKKGLFSDRDIVDIYCTALITYYPIPMSVSQTK